MIFSADKKPTKPGQFWALSSHTAAKPFVATVHITCKGKLDEGVEMSVQLVHAFETVEKINWLWGDEVEVPTVGRVVQGSNGREG